MQLSLSVIPELCMNRIVFSFLNRTDKCICGCVNVDKVLKSLRTLMCKYPVFSEGHLLLLFCEQTKGRHWQGMISKYSLNGTPNGPQLSGFTWCVYVSVNVCVCVCVWSGLSQVYAVFIRAVIDQILTAEVRWSITDA